MVIEIYSLDRGLIHQLTKILDDLQQDCNLCFKIECGIHKKVSHIDVLIIDLDLGDRSRSIAEYYKDCEHIKKIFVSHYKDDVFKIFKYHHASFFVKYDYSYVKEELMRCLQEVKKQTGLLFCKQNGRETALPIKNILSISQKDHFAEITMCDGTVNVIHASLGTLKNQLGYRFFLINRSEVVNLDYIRSTNGKELNLIDGRRFCVSRRKQKAFLSLYCAYDDHFLVKEGY